MDKMYLITGVSQVHPYTLNLAICHSKAKAEKLIGLLEELDEFNLAFEERMEKALAKAIASLPSGDFDTAFEAGEALESEYIEAYYFAPARVREVVSLLKVKEEGVWRLFFENDYLIEEVSVLG